MKREIMFRGKRTDNGEWIAGSLWNYLGQPKILSPANVVGYDVNPETVGQYTGITDKNGVKIFEGDILLSHYDDLHPEDIAIETVVWHGNAWCIKQDGSEPDQITEDGVLPLSEVIGNIHDNPEWMKNKE